MKRNYWLFRSKNDEEYCLKNNIISYGWSGLNFSESKEKGDSSVVFKTIYKQTNSNQAVNIAKNFTEITKGDIVILPYPMNLIAIGEILGKALYNKQRYDYDRSNYYEVRWLAKSISRNNLSDFFKRSLKYPASILKINQRLKEIDKLIIKYSTTKNIIKQGFYDVLKVKSVQLKKYNQFSKNLEIDFTYPLGHKKEGKPLERICLIGQSGTGKSSLLELIKREVTGDEVNTPNANEEAVDLEIKKYSNETKIALLNFPAYSVENIKKLDADEILDYEFEEVNGVIDFENTNPQEHWYPIQKEITEYQKKAIQFSAELGNAIKNMKDINLIKKEIDSFNDKIEIWKKKNKNPLEELDVFLEPIFSKFYLRVNREPNDLDDIKFIPIESISYNADGKKIKDNVETQFLSTGTQQILSRTVPLFALKPRDAIILIDEPENSLYPNVQKEFIDFITKESWNNIKTCQFFFATHSPTIASSFDPWEIVELKFNKNGKVEQKLYYEGKRHVDNYTVYPKYLDIDSILQRVFNVDDMSEEREAKIDEFADYNIKIRKLEEKEQQKTKEYNELVKKRNEIGQKLDWRVK